MENPCSRFNRTNQIKFLDWEVFDTLLWGDKYEKENAPVLVSPSLPWSELLNILWYKKQWDIYVEFLDKNITDIWSWLWWFIFKIEDSVDKVNAVDPLYSSSDKIKIMGIEELRAKNRYISIQDNIEIKKNKIKQIEEGILNLDFIVRKKPSDQQLRYDVENLHTEKSKLNSDITNSSKSLELNNRVYSDIKERKHRWYNNTDKLTLIGRWWEDTWLPEQSQDFVFITNTINKETANYKEMLIEADRILKQDWEIIISNNDKKIPDTLIKELNKTTKTINNIEILKLKKWDTDILLK